ncbi:Hemolysin, contains CBS domains [Paenibacillus sp. UNCCL117]|uniref:hemolysin family protein n=1 Tax=unclassified Paenibacillus TaxID=185978 RepID=UPI00088D50BA|nr:MULTISPECIES: hemolysin family protein [unclassified Paenibacillus]SDC07391.1 Hemolysin, contains CBS domains [Paenibacillus sp. cl123]SFW38038.1 Hemolysin, contains CBS domains [Paenibacillus sp. UNCCL117]
MASSIESHSTGLAGFDFGSIALNLVLVVFLVLLNGFFVAAEFSLVKVRQTRLQQLESEGNGKARYALAVTKKLDAYLSSTQLGITLASLGLGWVGEPAISHLIVEPLFGLMGLGHAWYADALSIAIGFAVITFLHIVLGELAPKSLAIQKSEMTSLWLSAPLMFFYKLFFPVIWLLNGAANRLLRLVGIHPATEHEAAHTEEEIRILMDESARSGHIDQDEMALFDNIFEFSERVAREIMLPRTDMDCLFTELSFEDNLNIVYETKHTRYPVATHDKDEIIGFVHITDMLTAKGAQQDLKRFVRPVLMVPESMEISHVLRMMQKKRSQLAIVIDEYGGTAGLITAEDILEEIVGEIHDEFDVTERPEIEKVGEGYSVDGRVLLEDLDDMLGLGIEDEEVDSIGGWLFKQLEGSVDKGQQLVHERFVLEITEVDRLRVMRLTIHQLPAAPEPEENGTREAED